VRAVERGSRLVTMHGTKTILQMPRGNLEGIYPRILMLKEIIGDIEGERYGLAFRLLRQHKIDINLLYDVNPAKFIANIGKFVQEVKHHVDWLNLFINSLNEDVRGKELEFMRPQSQEELIKRMHQEYIKTEIEGADVQVVSFTKVNKICDAIKEELVKIN
jgi:elongator complex protein 1